ncbi:MAG TPA: TolC family protein, partial [Acidisarcina sp.]
MTDLLHQLEYKKSPCMPLGRLAFHVCVVLAAVNVSATRAPAQVGGSTSAVPTQEGPSANGTGMNSTASPLPAPAGPASSAVPSSAFQGSVVNEKATGEMLPLTLDDAIQRGLRHNLGVILSSVNTRTAAGQRLQELQGLLPSVNASAKEAVQQVDLQAQGLRIPGFPAIIGPFGYTDIRGSLSWSLINISSLQNYLASRHNFEATQLSLADARDMVVLSVGNAYLTCVAEAARIDAVQAQVATAKVSLDQAASNHQAGTAPLLDELRARVDYQTQQQSLISTQNQFEKDKIALARTIGLPLDQKFTLSDTAPYAAMDAIDVDSAVKQALENRSDLRAMQQQVEGAERSKAAATAERLPTVTFNGDYGDIGPTLGHSHGTGDAVGEVDVPVFEEARLRGDARRADAQLDQRRAQLSDLRGQVSADVRDSILDIHAAQQQVEVAQSNVKLANEAL